MKFFMLTQSMLWVVINLIGKKIAILSRLKPAFMSIKVALHEGQGVRRTKDRRPFVLGRYDIGTNRSWAPSN